MRAAIGRDVVFGMQSITPYTRTPWPTPLPFTPQPCWLDDVLKPMSESGCSSKQMAWVLNRVVKDAETAPLHHPTVKRIFGRPRR